MLVFVYEFLCGGGLSGAAPIPSLLREGWAMLDAVLSDLGQCPGVRAVTMLDAAFSGATTAWPHVQTVLVEPGTDQQGFEKLARQADYTLVIAPEFDDLLAERCRWVENCGGRLLGPTVEAVHLTADKLRLAAHLQLRGVPTPPTQLWQWTDSIASFPIVVKPRFGAGSQSTYLLCNKVEIANAYQIEKEQPAGEMILQPYHAGFAASVALLRGPKAMLVLPAAAQHLSKDGRFRYLGGSLPLSADLNARAQRLARQASDTVAGLSGYVGVDLVLGASESGADDVAIEINPRLTTSYVGLRRLAQFNLAQALLAVTTGAPLPDLVWRNGSVRFDSAGTVELQEVSV